MIFWLNLIEPEIRSFNVNEDYQRQTTLSTARCNWFVGAIYHWRGCTGIDWNHLNDNCHSNHFKEMQYRTSLALLRIKNGDEIVSTKCVVELQQLRLDWAIANSQSNQDLNLKCIESLNLRRLYRSNSLIIEMISSYFEPFESNGLFQSFILKPARGWFVLIQNFWRGHLI